MRFRTPLLTALGPHVQDRRETMRAGDGMGGQCPREAGTLERQPPRRRIDGPADVPRAQLIGRIAHGFGPRHPHRAQPRSDPRKGHKPDLQRGNAQRRDSTQQQPAPHRTKCVPAGKDRHGKPSGT